MGAASLHIPVLLQETMYHLRPSVEAHLLDCTLGLGGHSAEMLRRGAAVTAIERDPAARAAAAERLAGQGERLRIVAGDFATAAAELADAGEIFDGVLADLGASSMQLDDATRGFSLRAEAAADMRMDPERGESALEFIDRHGEDDLADVIYRYAEEPRSRRIARALKRARAAGVSSAAGLAEAIRAAIPGRFRRHPAVRTFQALRIAVNEELEQLRGLLGLLPRLVRPGGRAVIISFHSLEDRMVKERLREDHRAGAYDDRAKKVVRAGPDEVAANPRARAAKLRWARRAGEAAT